MFLFSTSYFCIVMNIHVIQFKVMAFSWNIVYCLSEINIKKCGTLIHYCLWRLSYDCWSIYFTFCIVVCRTYGCHLLLIHATLIMKHQAINFWCKRSWIVFKTRLFGVPHSNVYLIIIDKEIWKNANHKRLA